MSILKTKKMLITLLCFINILAISISVFAGDGWVGVDPVPPTDPGIKNIGGKIVGALQVVGMIISVIVLMVLGIKYMMGSAEEKAEYKKTFIPYIVGAVLLFGASTLAKTIYNMVSNLNTAA